MNLKKAFKPFLVLCLFSIMISSSFDVMGQRSQSGRSPKDPDPISTSAKNKDNGKPPKSHLKSDKSLGVPLDGGLLVLLAGAGVAYFAARRKKKEI